METGEHAICANGNKILSNSLLFIKISGRMNLRRVILRCEKSEKNSTANSTPCGKVENRNFGIRTRMADQQTETVNAFKFKPFIFINSKRIGMNAVLSGASKTQCNHSGLPLITKATIRPIIIRK